MKNVAQPGYAGKVKGKRTEQLTFAHVVSGGAVKIGPGECKRFTGDETAYRFTVELNREPWLEGSYVGCFKEFPCLQSVKESFVMGGFSSSKAEISWRKICSALMCRRRKSAYDLSRQRAWFDDIFTSVTPWDDSFELKERCVWVRCERISASAMVQPSFSKIGAMVGEVVEIDEATEKREVRSSLVLGC
ncbi:hypothetical protein ACSQ67_021020 [Phaseolus vulgaris]